MSSSSTTTGEEINRLCNSYKEIISKAQDSLARLNRAPAATPLPPATSALPSLARLNRAPAATPLPPATSALPAAPALPANAFVPPVPRPGVNTASSAASFSLLSQFPDIDTTVIVAIIYYGFKAADLHKLDPLNRDTFNRATNQSEVSHWSVKEYKTPFSVIIPLQTYFDILTYHIKDAAATSSFFRYTAHLMKLVAEYEWAAVYNYHTIFFNRRQAEMARGDYTQWGKRDNDLFSEHVYAHRKATRSKSKATNRATNPNEPCRKFNDGRCTTTPCPRGRPHTCATCGKPELMGSR